MKFLKAKKKKASIFSDKNTKSQRESLQGLGSGNDLDPDAPTPLSLLVQKHQAH